MRVAEFCLCAGRRLALDEALSFSTDETPPHAREVPEWLRPAMAVAMDDLPGELIRRLTAGLPGGFTRIEALRVAWKRTMKGFREVPEPLVEALREYLGPSKVLERLASDRVMETFPALLGLAGPERLTVALWLDSRPEVQALARPSLLEVSRPSLEEARRVWLEQLEQGFLRPVGCRFPKEPTPPDAVSEGDADREVGMALERTRKRLVELRERHAAEAQEWKARRQGELEETGARLRRLEGERDAAKQALEALQAGYRADLQKALKEAENARWGHWFSRAEAEEAAVAALKPSFEDLVRQADHALERQAEADRRQGRRSEIRRQILLLRERRDQLDAAVCESLSPLPAVLRARDRVVSALRDREALLKDTSELLQTAGDVVQAIALADTEARLMRLRQLVQELSAVGVFDGETVRRLMEISVQRQQVLADVLLRERLSQGPAVTPAAILDGRVRGCVLVDAYNLIGEAGHALGSLVVPGQLPATLKALLPRFQRFASSRPQVEMLLVVDSPIEDSRSLGDNLRVVYSGGQGKHRADRVIEGQLAHLTSGKETRAVLVISHDAEVRRSAMRHGALVAHPQELAGRMMRMG